MEVAWQQNWSLAPIYPDEAALLNASTTRYTLMRTTAALDEMVVYWRVWAVITPITSLCSAVVILLIVLRPRLHTMTNRFVLGLALPDFIFSFLCGFTCALNASARVSNTATLV